MDYTACQAPLSMGFPKEEYWGDLPFPSPGDLPDLRMEPGSPALQTDSLPSELQGRLSLCLLELWFRVPQVSRLLAQRAYKLITAKSPNAIS